jgi:hypothetical protein
LKILFLRIDAVLGSVNLITHRKRTIKFGIADIRFGGCATAFPPLKFQQKMVYSWGKWQGCHLRGVWREHS